MTNTEKGNDMSSLEYIKKEERLTNEYNFKARILAEMLSDGEIEFDFFKKNIDALKAKYKKELAELKILTKS